MGNKDAFAIICICLRATEFIHNAGIGAKLCVVFYSSFQYTVFRIFMFYFSSCISANRYKSDTHDILWGLGQILQQKPSKCLMHTFSISERNGRLSSHALLPSSIPAPPPRSLCWLQMINDDNILNHYTCHSFFFNLNNIECIINIITGNCLYMLLLLLF